MSLRFCPNENETFCYFEQIISKESQCLSGCEAELIESEGDDADNNSNDDTTSDTYSSGDIDSGVTVSLNSEVDDVITTTATMEVDNKNDHDDDADGDDDDDDIQIKQSDTNPRDGFPVNSSSGTFLALKGSTKERIMERKINVSNASQSVGGHSVIIKIWRMVKALLKIFWFWSTDGSIY